MPRHESVSAKCDLKLPPSTALEPELNRLLRLYFSGELVEELTSLGGVLSINISTTGNRKKEATVSDTFINFLKTFSGDERELRDQLDPLSTRQLAFIARQFKIPVRSKTSAPELLRSIVSYVLSSRKWTGISGSAPTTPGRGGGMAAE